jgi:hypothetical protein
MDDKKSENSHENTFFLHIGFCDKYVNKPKIGYEAIKHHKMDLRKISH